MAKYYACDRCGRDKISGSFIYRITINTDIFDPVAINGTWEFCSKCAKDFKSFIIDKPVDTKANHES